MASVFATVVEKIHASPTKAYVITTGAGGSAIAALMSVPGCSRTLLNGNIPYHPVTTMRLLDYAPASFLSPTVGRQLAQYAYNDSLRLLGASAKDIVGIGATAAIQTDRSRQGKDAVFVTAWCADRVLDYSLVMSKENTRAAQEQLVSALIIRAIADAADVVYEGPPIEQEGELIIKGTPMSPPPVMALLQGRIPCALFNAHGDARLEMLPYEGEIGREGDTDTIKLLYPGSFKPLHWGHTELARVAGVVMKRILGEDKRVVITYEISATIVGKKDVNAEDFSQRLQQFLTANHRVAITTAKLFVEKAKMFPNHGLIVGVDTARRVIDPQFYDNSEENMLAAIEEIGSLGCYFVVGGRKVADGQWDDMNNVEVPRRIRHLFRAIQPADFRVDISSTEIRARRSSAEPEPNPEGA